MSWVHKNQDHLLTLFLIIVSIFGLIITAYLSFFGNKSGNELVFNNIIIGSAFGLVCIFGGLATIFPQKCTKITYSEKIKKSITIHSSKNSVSRGHHYPCEEYSNHILSIGTKRFCATCSGLLIGAIISLIGTIGYFSGFIIIEKLPYLVPLGIISVIIGLFQSILPKMSGALTRFLAGILLVIGSFFLLMNLDQVINSTIVELFFIFISIFWIYTKINLSQREHRVTCSNCLIKHCGN